MLSKKETFLLPLLVSLSLFGCASPPSDPDRKELDGRAYNGPTGKIVYAVKDISQGDVIKLDDLTEREILISRIPTGTLRNLSDAAGRVAKYGISSGQVVNAADVAAETDVIPLAINLKVSDLNKLRTMAEKQKVTDHELAEKWVLERMRGKK